MNDDGTTTWKELLDEFGDEIIACTLSDEELHRRFEYTYGSPQGSPFTAWSKEYVYFPVVYDGLESVGRAPRNPCDEPTEHMGGW